MFSRFLVYRRKKRCALMDEESVGKIFSGQFSIHLCPSFGTFSSLWTRYLDGAKYAFFLPIEVPRRDAFVG